QNPSILGTAQVVNGIAILNVAFSTHGPHDIAARFLVAPADGNAEDSPLATFADAVDVQATPVLVALGSTINSTTYGVGGTVLSASVISSYTGVAISSGRVQFAINGVDVGGFVTLDESGIATLDLTGTDGVP